MDCPIIVSSSQLLGVKPKCEFVAIVQPINKVVYVIADVVPQQELDKYAVFLSSGTEDTWVSNADVSGSRFRIVTAPTTVDIPKMCISPGFLRSQAELQPLVIPALTYLFLVQGKNASERTKAVVKPTRDGAAAAMLHEKIHSVGRKLASARGIGVMAQTYEVLIRNMAQVMNGYSVVFTGTILSSEISKLFPANPNAGSRWKFSKVRDIAGLCNVALEKDNRGQATTIGVWC